MSVAKTFLPGEPPVVRRIASVHSQAKDFLEAMILTLYYMFLLMRVHKAIWVAETAEVSYGERSTQ